MRVRDALRKQVNQLSRADERALADARRSSNYEATGTGSRSLMRATKATKLAEQEEARIVMIEPSIASENHGDG